MNLFEQTPDSIKVAVSTAPPALTMFGVSIEAWTWILSIIVSIMFIIEKFPIMVTRFHQFKRWCRETFSKKH